MKKQSTGNAWIITAFFTLFMIIMTFNLIVFPASAQDTMEIYGIGQAGLTTLASVTSLVGLFAGLIFGPMLDRKGPRKTILYAMVIGVIFFFIRVFVTNYTIVVILTFLASFFVGVCQVAAAKVLDTWFTKDKVSVAFAFQSAGAGIGSAAAFLIASLLGLRNSLLLIAIAYTLLWVMWIFIGGEGPYAMPTSGPPKGGFAVVFKSSYLWMLAIAYSCAVGSTLLINSYCINAFIAKGLDPSAASMMGMVINLSLLGGGYLGTYLMGVIKRYNVVTIICFTGGAIGYLLAWFTPLGVNTWIFMILGGLIIGGGIGLTAGRTPLVPLTGQFSQEYIGTASGAMETIKGVLTFVLPIAIAQWFQTNYNGIFIAFAVLCAIGLVTGGILVPELGPKGQLQKDAKLKADSAAE
ncbi:MAG: MFS transporter [Fastidiosipilaceae bacterium]|nr:MFS transporter [Clostridiaceae bacterium]